MNCTDAFDDDASDDDDFTSPTHLSPCGCRARGRGGRLLALGVQEFRECDGRGEAAEQRHGGRRQRHLRIEQAQVHRGLSARSGVHVVPAQC